MSKVADRTSIEKSIAKKFFRTLNLKEYKIEYDKLEKEVNREVARDLFSDKLDDGCPECENDLFLDEKHDIYYCPIGCFEVNDL